MTTGEWVLWVSLIVLGNAGAGLCAGCEMGLYSINRVRLTILARQAREAPAASVSPRQRAAKVLYKEFEHPARVLAALLIGYNVFSYLGALGITSILKNFRAGDGLVIVLDTLLISPLLFVVADGFPKEAFRTNPERLTYAMAWPIRWLRVGLTWCGALGATTLIASAFSRLFKGADGSAVVGARERMASLLKEGARHGVISEAQVTLLDRALALRETTVGDEMVAWEACRTVNAEWNRARVLDLLSRSPSSRFPLVDGRGQVLGVVELADVCLNPTTPVSRLATPALFLEEELSVRPALMRLRSSGAHLAIVGSPQRPVGIVTAKDLVEPLTGELKAF